MNMDATKDVIEAGICDQTVVVRVKGRGLFRNCQPLKKYADLLIDRGCRTVIVDARLCDYMDSSFLGTLTGMAIRLKKTGGGEVQLVNLNQKVRETVQAIGLNHIFRLLDTRDLSQVATAPLTPDEFDKHKLAESMLEAHAHLIAADQTNAARFKNVRIALEKELADEQPDPQAKGKA
jgi:anti-sigma B factor antagonist